MTTMNLEKFELGKCYRHISGRAIHICGIAQTSTWGIVFIAKSNDCLNLTPVPMNDSDATDGWFEVPKSDFLGTQMPRDEAKANAKLMAAAPEMLEALQSIENDNVHMPPAIWQLIQYAIKKATT